MTCDGCGTPGIEHWHQAEAPARAPLYPYLNYSLWLCPVCDDGMRQP